MTMQPDSILIFSIAHAMQESPEVVQEDILKLIRRQAELEDENEELRRLLGRPQFTGIRAKDVGRKQARRSGGRRPPYQ
jgi:hypothetical protein